MQYGKGTKCRVKHKTRILADIGIAEAETTIAYKISQKVNARSADGSDGQDTLREGTELQFVGFTLHGDVKAVSPIDPERIIVIAREAVEMYNEGLRIWQTVREFLRKAGQFLSGVWATVRNTFAKKKKDSTEENSDNERQ